jgi:ABC-type uncharacterized transport system permease subunit
VTLLCFTLDTRKPQAMEFFAGLIFMLVILFLIMLALVLIFKEFPSIGGYCK